MCRLNAKAHHADSLGLVHRQEEKVQTLFWLNLGYFGGWPSLGYRNCFVGQMPT